MNNDIKKMTALTTITDFIDKAIFNFFENMNGIEISAVLVLFAISLWFFIAYMFKKKWSDKEE